ncbi:PilW family protein [Pseudomonas sp.]|uniref:PilW family protein n=1 Tax=Pseudomonas sp. TaxID=306 RepID=UPI003BB6A105
MRLLSLQFRQRGLSLIELMVAILLSSLLLLGVLELYSNTSRSDRSGSALADLQDDARVAMEFIKRDIRRAGYMGCADPQAGFSGMGFDYPEDAFREMTLTSLTLSYASPDALNGATGSPAALVLSNTNSTDDEWHLLTDCQTAVPFKGDYVPASRTVRSTTPADIRDFPSNTSYLHTFREVRYSLANGQLMRAEQSSGAQAAPDAVAANNQAIISGVTALSFAYGLATSAGTNTWFDAANPPPASPSAANFVDLSQIKITLTLQSTTDTAISKSFTSVVQLRNRL